MAPNLNLTEIYPESFTQGHTESLAESIEQSLRTGFIDCNLVSHGEFQPRLLINDSKRGQKVLTCIIDELTCCEEFFFSVAFITNSGVITLINTLKDLEDKGIRGKIVTSQYLNFTEPTALERLLQFKNIELRILTEGNLHTKGYIFRFKKNSMNSDANNSQSDTYSMIVGSSNMTQDALSANKEWNLKVSSTGSGALIKSTLQEFDYLFQNATVVDQVWIDEYRKIYSSVDYDKKSERDSISVNEVEGITNTSGTILSYQAILPNKMQVEALGALETLRKYGKNKALLISATGTGKTYLSAFDARVYRPGRLLFIIHRENVARASMKSFKAVFGESKTMGILCGKEKTYDADFIFTTIQTLSQDEVLYKFTRNCFDYIIIDEVHRSGAKTYRKIIEYFTPKFLLGMSATPERTDGYDIFQAFDYNIAYEIRLHHALEQNMLIPFHYFGVSDIKVNGELLDEYADFNKLVCSERVDKIVQYANFYGCDKGRVKGLIFCSRNDEAKQISHELNKRGLNTVALDGSSSEEEREDCIDRLEQNEFDSTVDTAGPLDYIVTVDIFNEGVDIPTVNQIIMLRPTQSAIIFVQQLGRGLRKHQNKEYLTVIDFIGSYANNYLISIALYGDSSYNKDNLRKLINSGSSYIPGASTVSFDFISKEKIFSSINTSNLSTKRDLVKDYQLLKYKLGRVPDMTDFVEHGSRDPYSYVKYSGSYFEFILPLEDSLRGQLNPDEMRLLEFFSLEICNAKRVEDMLILRTLVEKRSVSFEDIIRDVNNEYGKTTSIQLIEHALRCLNADFLKQQDKDKYKVKSIAERQGNKVIIGEQLSETIKNFYFEYYLLDLLEYAINKYKATYSAESYYDGFMLYGKYSRKDVCRILEWEKDEAAVIFGYRIKYNTCPIFVTYEKKDDIIERTKYEDKFINNRLFSWMTRNRATTESSEVLQIKNYKNTGLRIPLFIKKSDGEGTDFYYMGDVEPYGDPFQTTIDNDEGKNLPIVRFLFAMKVPVEYNLLKYFEN